MGFGQILILYFSTFSNLWLPSDKHKDLMDWEFLMSSHTFALRKILFNLSLCNLSNKDNRYYIFKFHTKLYNNSALFTCFFWNTRVCHPQRMEPSPSLPLGITDQILHPHLCLSLAFFSYEVWGLNTGREVGAGSWWGHRWNQSSLGLIIVETGQMVYGDSLVFSPLLYVSKIPIIKRLKWRRCYLPEGWQWSVSLSCKPGSVLNSIFSCCSRSWPRFSCLHSLTLSILL